MQILNPMTLKIELDEQQTQRLRVPHNGLLGLAGDAVEADMNVLS